MDRDHGKRKLERSASPRPHKRVKNVSSQPNIWARAASAVSSFFTRHFGRSPQLTPFEPPVFEPPPIHGHILSLSDDVLSVILTFVPPPFLLTCMLISKRFYFVAHRYESLDVTVSEDDELTSVVDGLASFYRLRSLTFREVEETDNHEELFELLPQLTCLDTLTLTLTRPFADVASFLPQCLCLQDLNLLVCHLSQQQWASVASSLPLIPRLRCFSASFRYLEIVEENRFAVELGRALPKCTSLRTLDICDVHIGSSRFADGLRQCTTITKMVLKRNFIESNINVSHFAAALSALQNLQSFVLEDQSLSDECNVQIVRSLSSCHALTHLTLKSMGLRQDAIDCLGSNSWPVLVRLDISHNYCCATATDCQQVARFLSRCPALRELYMSCTYITSEGLDQLASCFPSLASLEILDLTRNRRLSRDCASGASQFTAMLPSLTSLVSLRLGDTGMGPSMHVLAAAIGSLKSLAVLDMRHIGLGDSGMKSLADHLPHCSHLTDLDLASNSLSAKGMTHVGRLLAALPALTRLNLTGTFKDAGIPALARALPKAPALHTLYMHDRARTFYFSRKSAGILARALKKCVHLRIIAIGTASYAQTNPLVTAINAINKSRPRDESICVEVYKDVQGRDTLVRL